MIKIKLLHIVGKQLFPFILIISVLYHFHIHQPKI